MIRAASETLTTSWLPLLRSMTPPSGAVVVGAGSGIGALVSLLADWALPNVILAEADERQFGHLTSRHKKRADWQFLNVLVASEAGDTMFFQATDPAASGLLSVENLKDLWPNARTIGAHMLPAVTLPKLLDASDVIATWLLVDCLPALPIIESADGYLNAVEMIVARVVLDPNMLIETKADQRELDVFLVSRDFRCVAVQPCRQQVIGHALYVRDHAKMKSQIKEALSQENKLLQERVDDLKRAKADDAQAVRTLQVQLRQFILQCETSDRALKSKSVEHDSAKAALEALGRELRETKRLWEEQAVLSTERQAQIDHLNAELAETRLRQLALDGEMTKVEAQLNLIKETLIERRSS
jgi:hypothetical protein